MFAAAMAILAVAGVVMLALAVYDAQLWAEHWSYEKHRED